MTSSTSAPAPSSPASIPSFIFKPDVRAIVAIALLIFCAASAPARDLVIITNLVSFNGTNGQQPSGVLLQAKDGFIYGTAPYGGTNSLSAGTVFRVTTSGGFSNLVFFNVANGANPNSGLIQGSNGNLYGTTAFGGAYVSMDTNQQGFGTVFQLTTNGTLTTLSSFSNSLGKNPNALLEVSPGIFYGTANTGGANTDFFGHGYGTVFRADTNGTLTNLLSFNNVDGGNPSAGLTMAGGMMFGAATSGGSFEDGTVFQLTSNGAIPSFFTFNLTNGGVPNTLITGKDGNLYGTTLFGGSNHLGTLFRLGTNLALTTLVNFNGTNGGAPTALTEGTDGNLYGLTAQDGAYGYGNVFRATTNGAVTSLYDFTGGSDGYGGANIIQGSDGNFYGSTLYGGTNGIGNVFKLSVFPAPAIQSLVRKGTSLMLSWNAVSNLTYDVQYTTNLALTNWTQLQSVSLSNGLCTFSNDAGTDQRRFYRLVMHQ